MITIVTATVGFAKVLKTKEVKESIIQGMRDIVKESGEKDCSDRGLYRTLTQTKHLGHIKITFWKIFVFIFYDHFCKITNLRQIDEKL